MDLGNWDRSLYDAVQKEIVELGGCLGCVDPLVIPVSALNGDNIVDPSAAAPWYNGPTVLRCARKRPGRFVGLIKLRCATPDSVGSASTRGRSHLRRQWSTAARSRPATK
jgi:hypothetical protein